MKSNLISRKKLESFDSLFVGRPNDIEQNLSQLLPEANALKDKSIYLQILSQIALAQAMQKKFKQAHRTLDLAEKQLTSDYKLAHIRILLERGRIYHQSNNMKTAIPLFKKSYEISKKNKFDFHTINAAHMLPLVVKDDHEKIKWNKIAIAMTKKTKDKRAREWLAVLYNNIGANYIDAKQYENAIAAYKQCKKIAEKKPGYSHVVLGAKWGIAKSLRLLESYDEALNMQLAIVNEYNDISKSKTLPQELINSALGQVYEELAEIYFEKVKIYSTLAYANLSKDFWFIKLAPQRLARMKRLRSGVSVFG